MVPQLLELSLKGLEYVVGWDMNDPSGWLTSSAISWALKSIKNGLHIYLIHLEFPIHQFLTYYLLK